MRISSISPVEPNSNVSSFTVWNATESGQDDEKQEVLSKTSFTIMGTYILIIGCLATIGNLTVVLTIGRDKKLRKKPQLCLICNMAVADLGISVFGFPMVMTSAFSGRWLYGDIGCQMYAFLTFLFSIVSMNTLVALAVYRYIIICKPRYKYLLTVSKLPRVLIPIWGYALLTTTPPLYGWSAYTYEPFEVSCTMRWQGKEWIDVSYIIFTMVFCYTGHLALLIYFYGSISARSSQLFSESPNATLGLPQRRAQREAKSSLMCALMVVAFIVVWTPYAVVSLMHAFYSGTMPIAALTLPTMFAKCGPLVNSIIYMVVNTNFRNQVIKIWCKCLRRRVQPMPDNMPQKRHHGPAAEANSAFVVERPTEDAFNVNNLRIVPVCWEDFDVHTEEANGNPQEMALPILNDLQSRFQSKGNEVIIHNNDVYLENDRGHGNDWQLCQETEVTAFESGINSLSVTPQSMNESGAETQSSRGSGSVEGAVLSLPGGSPRSSTASIVSSTGGCPTENKLVCRKRTRTLNKRGQASKGAVSRLKTKPKLTCLPPLESSELTDLNSIQDGIQTPRLLTHAAKCTDLFCKDKLNCQAVKCKLPNTT